MKMKFQCRKKCKPFAKASTRAMIIVNRRMEAIMTQNKTNGRRNNCVLNNEKDALYFELEVLLLSFYSVR